MKFSVRRALFEFFSIVVAVLVALFLTEARENYENKRDSKKSFRLIQEEVSANLDLIMLDSVDHLRKLRILRQWIAAEPEVRDTMRLEVEIIHSLTKATAWEVAKLNQVVHHLPDTLVMDISRVYIMQEFYDQNGREMYSQMTGILSGRENGHLSESSAYAYDFELLKELGAVRGLKSVYEEFLEKYPIKPSD